MVLFYSIYATLLLGTGWFLFKWFRKKTRKSDVRDKVISLETDEENLSTVKAFKATHKGAEKAKEKVEEFLGDK